MKCDFGDQCQINIYNRHVCSACRLKKCFEVGMCPEMIRRSQGKTQQLPTLNLLEKDQSLLSTDQWTQISNLIHSYDEHSSLAIIKNYMNEFDRLPPKLRFKINIEKIYEIVTIVYQATETFIRSNQDFASLSSDDRSIVLHGAVDNLSCLGGGFLLRESGLITYLPFLQGLEQAYGTIPYNLTLTVISLLDQDINLVKLTLALFAFCTSTSTIFNENSSLIYIKNHQNILHIQNVYAELIWKYLLYKYRFDQAIRRFTHLVKCLIASVTVKTYLQTIQEHTSSVSSLVQKIEEQQ